MWGLRLVQTARWAVCTRRLTITGLCREVTIGCLKRFFKRRQQRNVFRRLQRRDSPGLFDQRMAVPHKGFEFSDDRIALATGDFSRQNRFQVSGHLRKFGIELLKTFVYFS